MWALSHSRQCLYIPLCKDGKTHEGNRPEEGQEEWTQGIGATGRSPAPSSVLSPQHKEETPQKRKQGATKYDQTQ